MEEYCAKLGERIVLLEAKMLGIEKHLQLMTTSIQKLQDWQEATEKK